MKKNTPVTSHQSSVTSHQSLKKIGITGQSGFMGSHLYNNINLYPKEFQLIEFKKSYFDNPDELDAFVEKCDVIFHLAAMNRHEDPDVIYNINIVLCRKLIDSLDRTQSSAHILLSSSTQEERDNLYGKSKQESRELFSGWADNSEGHFTALIIPNVFGPFGKPFYNSFIATFCHLLTHEGNPEIHQDNEVELIYIQELVEFMLDCVRKENFNNNLRIEGTQSINVSEVLSTLQRFKDVYFDNGNIPSLNNTFEINLFNTYRSYIDNRDFFPYKNTLHSDNRGSFVELVRLGIGGQVSFSTTVPGITRGNHFHTRKIERFSVIKGTAEIEIRKIDSGEKLSFVINADEPAFVDMPIWYTHNIKNIGDDVLYTVFWISEQYDEEDADTFFLED